MPTKLSIILPFLFLLIFCGCQVNNQTGQTEKTNQLANPASTNCTQKGGQLKIEKKPDNSEYGVCIFDDNRQCEEWALYNQICPVGGLKVTGYTTDAARYCAITGNQFTPAANDSGTCTIKENGKTCSIDEYYLNHCATTPLPQPQTPFDQTT